MRMYDPGRIVHAEERADPSVHVHASACGCKSGFHLLPIGSWAEGGGGGAGTGRLSGILIVLLHVAELHECGGRREQPEAMWGMREKPRERASLGFTGTVETAQSPDTLQGGWLGRERGSGIQDLGTVGKILVRFRAILLFA